MLTGSIVAIVTPMGEDGKLDLARFKALMDWHVAEGTDGIVVVGTTGESPTVDFDEHKELIRVAVEHAAGRIPAIGFDWADRVDDHHMLTVDSEIRATVERSGVVLIGWRELRELQRSA